MGGVDRGAVAGALKEPYGSGWGPTVTGGQATRLDPGPGPWPDGPAAQVSHCQAHAWGPRPSGLTADGPQAHAGQALRPWRPPKHLLLWPLRGWGHILPGGTWPGPDPGPDTALTGGWCSLIDQVWRATGEGRGEGGGGRSRAQPATRRWRGRSRSAQGPRGQARSGDRFSPTMTSGQPGPQS